MTDTPDSTNMHTAKTPLDEDKIVGRNLRKIRRDQELTQEALGKLVNLTFQQIQKYETGTNRISAGRLVHLARKLDVPILDFFTGIDLPNPSNSDCAACGSEVVSGLQSEIADRLKEVAQPEKLEAILMIAQQLASEHQPVPR